MQQDGGAIGARRPVLEGSYRDPVGGEFGGPWLAAFEPVVVGDSDTGWVVIAQERESFE